MLVMLAAHWGDPYKRHEDAIIGSLIADGKRSVIGGRIRLPGQL